MIVGAAVMLFNEDIVLNRPPSTTDQVTAGMEVVAVEGLAGNPRMQRPAVLRRVGLRVQNRVDFFAGDDVDFLTSSPASARTVRCRACGSQHWFQTAFCVPSTTTTRP
ncbi:MAG: hypothetical protein CO095_15200 [Armatimonadetes bacterium CG_4_9_14_3_um_filter_58_7]|nr:MAG: hypothetical protein CO095_15200 [Armatimonadetes bacterium CG_4_9_14_3_um_filter_58_7]